MKSWFCVFLGWFVSMAGVLPVAAQTPELWKGVVLVEGGTLAGDWKPVVPHPDSQDRWDQWELMEKMSRPEQLRRSAPPGATMVPDRNGRSVLVVAPSAGVRGMVVDVGSGMADIRGAGVKNAMLRLGEGGQVVVQDSALSGFHVVESQGEKPGGMILMTGCGISGSFGGAFYQRQPALGHPGLSFSRSAAAVGQPPGSAASFGDRLPF